MSRYSASSFLCKSNPRPWNSSRSTSSCIANTNPNPNGRSSCIANTNAPSSCIEGRLAQVPMREEDVTIVDDEAHDAFTAYYAESNKSSDRSTTLAQPTHNAHIILAHTQCPHNPRIILAHTQCSHNAHIILAHTMLTQRSLIQLIQRAEVNQIIGHLMCACMLAGRLYSRTHLVSQSRNRRKGSQLLNYGR